MKKRVYVLSFCCLLLLTGCNKKAANNISNNDETGQYKIEKEENIEDDKELLKIQFWEDNYIDRPEADYKMRSLNINIDSNLIIEAIDKKYENESFLKDLTDIIYKDFNVKIDKNWHYTIRYYNKETKTGYIGFIYWIDDIIATNRAISFFFDNSIINEVSYSYLDDELDETALLYRYNYFINHYKQERVVIEKFKDYYEIKNDAFHYTYSFADNKLMYTYQIFYKHLGIGIIDNDYGTEMYIEPKLIEEILKTEKIVIRDSNSHEIINSINEINDESFTLLVPNNNVASLEKHVPFYSINDGIIHVQVGEIIHPMQEEHYIMWIALVTNDEKITKVNLKPNDKPECIFKYKEGSVIYAYCNIHGLWKVEIK